MRIRFLSYCNQGDFIRRKIPVFLLLFPLLFLSCSRVSNHSPVIPPPTNPLIREFIGYGVVSVSFAQVLDEPRQDGATLTILRRSSLVRIIERRILRNRGLSEVWVLVEAQGSEGKVEGWLGESSINVFNTEVQASTAAGAMSP